jgi:hypothetical protein
MEPGSTILVTIPGLNSTHQSGLPYDHAMAYIGGDKVLYMAARPKPIPGVDLATTGRNESGFEPFYSTYAMATIG